MLPSRQRYKGSLLHALQPAQPGELTQGGNGNA